jgi:hypothetical protein
MEVTIEANGVVSATLHVPPNITAPCSDSYVSQLLAASNHIPLTLHYVLNSGGR